MYIQFDTKRTLSRLYKNELPVWKWIFLLTRRAFVHRIVKHPNLILKPHVLLLQLTTILLHIIVMPINAKNLVYYKRLSIVFPFFRHCNRWVIYTVQMKKLIWAVFTTFLTMNISLSNYSNKPRILTKNMLQYFVLFKCHLYPIIIWEIQRECP